MLRRKQRGCHKQGFGSPEYVPASAFASGLGSSLASSSDASSSVFTGASSLCFSADSSSVALFTLFSFSLRFSFSDSGSDADDTDDTDDTDDAEGVASCATNVVSAGAGIASSLLLAAALRAVLKNTLIKENKSMSRKLRF